jgi:hypothetical protein
MKVKFLLLIFVFLINGCGLFQGTNTGNPGIANEQITTPAGYLTTYSDRLSHQICSSLNRCFPSASYVNCIASNSDNPQIPVELKLNTNYATLSIIKEAEIQHQLIISTINGNSCILSIESISCESTEMVGAYDSNEPTNFGNDYLLLRSNPNCGMIFTPL